MFFTKFYKRSSVSIDFVVSIFSSYTIDPVTANSTVKVSHNHNLPVLPCVQLRHYFFNFSVALLYLSFFPDMSGMYTWIRTAQFRPMSRLIPITFGPSDTTFVTRWSRLSQIKKPTPFLPLSLQSLTYSLYVLSFYL